MKNTKVIICVLVVVPFLLWPSLTLAQKKGGEETARQQKLPAYSDRVALNDVWQGTWFSKKGFVYSAQMHLKVRADNTVQGRINWTLSKSPREKEQSKIGLTGVEFVRGEYHPKFRILMMEGYRKDDPHGILGLDRYRLFLADNQKVLGGITWNHGKWKAIFTLDR